MGTSAPELVVNMISSQSEGQGVNPMEVVFGNIIGSNIFNTFVILGIASVIYPLEVRSGVLRKDLPYSFFALIALFFFVNDQFFFGNPDTLGMYDAVFLLVAFVVFLWHTFRNARRHSDSEEELEDIVLLPVWKSVLYVSLGMVGLALGGEFAVENAVEVAVHYGMSGRMIGLTILRRAPHYPSWLPPQWLPSRGSRTWLWAMWWALTSSTFCWYWGSRVS